MRTIFILIITLLISACNYHAITKPSDPDSPVVRIEWMQGNGEVIEYSLRLGSSGASLEKKGVNKSGLYHSKKQLPLKEWSDLADWLNGKGYWNQSIRDLSTPTIDGQTYKVFVKLTYKQKSVTQHGQTDTCIYDLYDYLDILWKNH